MYSGMSTHVLEAEYMCQALPDGPPSTSRTYPAQTATSNWANRSRRAPRGTAGAVIAVRVSRDLLARISDYAAMRGMSVTEVFLEGAERLVAPEISASE